MSLSKTASKNFLEMGDLTINKNNQLIFNNKKTEDELKKKNPIWSEFIKPNTLKYGERIEKLKLFPISSIKDNKSLLVNIKKLAEQLFNNISRKSYTSGEVRSNHGSYNHMRELYLGIYLSQYKYKINNKETDLFDNRIFSFCIIMATYFVNICRVNEGNFINRDQKTKEYHPQYAKIVLSNKVISKWFPNTEKLIKKCKGFAQSIHQYYSCLMYMAIMKQIIGKENHWLIELCGFSICYFHNEKNESNSSLEPVFFLHYFINTPHYIDHCRGTYSGSISDIIPRTLINKYLISQDKLEFSKNLLLKIIENFYKSEEFTKPKDFNIKNYVDDVYKKNSNFNNRNKIIKLCYQYIFLQERIKGHFYEKQDKNSKTQNFTKLWNKLRFNDFY